MADITIKVSYDSIETAINQFNSCRDGLNQAIERMRAAVGEVDSTWNGSASEAYVNKFFTIYNNMRTHEGPLQETIEALKNAVNEYRGVEQEARSSFESVEMAQNPFGG